MNEIVRAGEFYSKKLIVSEKSKSESERAKNCVRESRNE